MDEGHCIHGFAPEFCPDIGCPHRRELDSRDATIKRLTAERDSLAASLEEARAGLAEFAHEAGLAAGRFLHQRDAARAELSELRARVGNLCLSRSTDGDVCVRSDSHEGPHSGSGATWTSWAPPEAPTDKGETP